MGLKRGAWVSGMLGKRSGCSWAMDEDHPAGAWVQIQTPPLTSSETLGEVLGSLLQLLPLDPPSRHSCGDCLGYLGKALGRETGCYCGHAFALQHLR